MQRVKADRHIPGKTTYFGQCTDPWVHESGRSYRRADGATCIRDEAGVIVEFDAHIPTDAPARPPSDGTRRSVRR